MNKGFITNIDTFRIIAKYKFQKYYNCATDTVFIELEEAQRLGLEEKMWLLIEELSNKTNRIYSLKMDNKGIYIKGED